MDFVRGVVLPLFLLFVAAALGALGMAANDDAYALAASAARVGTNPAAAAPRAEAEALRRTLRKRSVETANDSLGLYAVAALVLALDGLLLASRLLPYRTDEADPGPAPPGAAG